MLSIFSFCKNINFFTGENLFFMTVFVIIFTILLAVTINLSRMPDKYILSDKFFEIDGRSKPIPVELYLKSTKKKYFFGKTW